MRTRPSGTAALLVECDHLEEVLATYDAVRRAHDDGRLPGVVDVVPAARTVLVTLDPTSTHPERVRDLIHGLDPAADRPREDVAADVLEVPVRYDGEDLTEVGRILGCAPEEVVRRHTGVVWTVAFCGFAPGFGYLTADEGEWDVPRRDDPRTRVPVGAVGLAGGFTGVYPQPSPGGWQLIGRTDLEVFDLEREPPALLAPRRRVRFVAAETS